MSLIYSIILQINLFFGLFIFSGETDANQKHVLQGQSNYSLNELGRSQATKAGAKLKAERFDWVYSSDQVLFHFIWIIKFDFSCQNSQIRFESILFEENDSIGSTPQIRFGSIDAHGLKIQGTG